MRGVSYAGSVFLPLEAACALAHSCAALGIVTARSRGEWEAQWLWGSGAALEAQVCRVPLNLWAIITDGRTQLLPAANAEGQHQRAQPSRLRTSPGSGVWPKGGGFHQTVKSL